MPTPGEWQSLPPSRHGKYWNIVVAGSQWCIATIHNGAPGDTLDTEAENALLMAASKELLAALKQVEWSGMEEREEGGYYQCCPCCGAPAPYYEDDDDAGGEHESSCEVSAAIAKAEPPQ